jgi:DeoR/GlpR family transcriptional regulator of sugar metabolism
LKETKMSIKSNERKKEILKILSHREKATIEELQAGLDVTGMTIRNYLNTLQAEGYIQRIHGGAVLKGKLKYEFPFQERIAKNLAEKQAIARAAISFIGPKEAIYLDSGSTVLQLAKRLKDRTDLVIVTNSLPILAELTSAPGIKLFGIGGEVNRDHCCFTGSMTINMLKQFYFDKVFLGTDGLSIERGLTTEDFAVAEIERAVIENSKERIVLADHTKIGSIGFTSSISALGEIHRLITDEGTDPGYLESLKQGGMSILVAGK